jgi:hypothetical protein
MSGWEELSRLSAYPALQEPWALMGALAALGLAIGFLTGLFGVGGAFLLVPMLKVLFGVPYPIAVGSSLSFTLGTGVTGMLRHWRLGNFEPRSMALLAAGAMVGAVGGAEMNGVLAGALGDDDGRGYTLVMHGLFVAVLLATAWLVFRDGVKQRARRPLLGRLALGWRIDLPAAKLTGISVAGMVLTGVVIGLTKGLLGIGGGVLFMPVLVLAVGLTAHQAVGTSLGVVVFSSLTGTVAYGLHGTVNLWLVMAMLAGSTIGIQIGAAACERLHARRLRRWFAVVVVLAATAIAADLVRKVVEG